MTDLQRNFKGYKRPRDDFDANSPLTYVSMKVTFLLPILPAVLLKRAQNTTHKYETVNVQTRNNETFK